MRNDENYWYNDSYFQPREKDENASLTYEVFKIFNNFSIYLML